jgi:hypothetical protein
MNSNDIINAANHFLMDKRVQYLNNLKGQFVLRIKTENKLGQYKRYLYEVFFINKVLTPCLVGTASLILPTQGGHEEENYREMDIQLTKLMFTILNTEDWLEHFILGDYGLDG